MRGGIPPGVLNLLQVTTTLLMISLAGPLLTAAGRESMRVAWTARLLAAVLLTGVLATALAFSVQVWAQQHTSSSHAAILFTLEPVFAALTSFVFFQERLGLRALAGGRADSGAASCSPSSKGRRRLPRNRND